MDNYVDNWKCLSYIENEMDSSYNLIFSMLYNNSWPLYM